MRILRIIIDPVINGKKMSKWYNVNVRELHSNILKELTKITSEDFIIVGEIVSTDIPIKEDCYKYTEEEYWKALTVNGSEHRPDWMDYKIFIDGFDLINKRNNGEFDEVHLLGIPWSGAYESRLVGKTAIRCNSPEYIADCDNFAIMGFNIERQIQEAIEAYGHRSEFILRHCFPKSYEVLTKCVGSIHIPFNTTKDYDWGNETMVNSYAHWIHDRNGTDFFPVPANCHEWGCNGLGWFEYWFSHITPEAMDIIVHSDKIKIME
jgi:hypothetical protein